MARRVKEESKASRQAQVTLFARDEEKAAPEKERSVQTPSGVNTITAVIRRAEHSILWKKSISLSVLKPEKVSTLVGPCQADGCASIDLRCTDRNLRSRLDTFTLEMRLKNGGLSKHHDEELVQTWPRPCSGPSRGACRICSGGHCARAGRTWDADRERVPVHLQRHPHERQLPARG